MPVDRLSMRLGEKRDKGRRSEPDHPPQNLQRHQTCHSYPDRTRITRLPEQDSAHIPLKPQQKWQFRACFTSNVRFPRPLSAKEPSYPLCSPLITASTCSSDTRGSLRRLFRHGSLPGFHLVLAFSRRPHISFITMSASHFGPTYSRLCLSLRSPV